MATARLGRDIQDEPTISCSVPSKFSEITVTCLKEAGANSK